MRRVVLVAVMAVAGLFLQGCGDGDTAEPSPSPTASPESSGAETTPSKSSGPTGPATEGPPAESWPSDDVSQPFGGTVPPVPILVDLRVASHAEDGYDRVVLEFDTLPGYEIGYSDDIVYDGSGEPVDLPGDAFVQLVFNPAQAHDEEGNASLPDAPVDPVEVDFAALDAYVLNGDFEGHVSVALGVADEVGFRVGHFVADNGNAVVYIDLATP